MNPYPYSVFWWGLPHNIRRNIYRKFMTERYWSIMQYRSNKNRTDYTLKGFDEKQCIFVHIPKCAGISINMSLFGNLGGGHLTIMDYQLIYGKQVFDKYFKFTIVRNPWERLVSAFHFLKKGGMFPQDRIWAEKNLSKYHDFHEFVCGLQWDKSPLTWIHFIPQYKYVCDPYKIIRVDFIGRLETLSNDFKYINQKIDINQKMVLNALNIGNEKQKTYIDYYTPKTRKIVENIYKQDIRIFDYSFA